MLKSADESIEVSVVVFTYAVIIINAFALFIALIAILVYLGGKLTAIDLENAFIFIGIIMGASIVVYSAIISIIRKMLLD